MCALACACARLGVQSIVIRRSLSLTCMRVLSFAVEASLPVILAHRCPLVCRFVIVILIVILIVVVGRFAGTLHQSRF